MTLQGLTQWKWKDFKDITIQANKSQLEVMLLEIRKEQERRTKRQTQNLKGGQIN